MPDVKMSEEFIEEEELAEQAAEEDLVSEEEEEYDEEEGNQVEDLDPSESIWEDGPAAGQIVAWKEQFGDVFVSSFTPTEHVVWRTLNRFEYRGHMRHIEQLSQSGQYTAAEASLVNEEAICQICVLYPQLTPDYFAGEMAGIPSSLAQDILEASGFVALEVRKL